MYWETFKTPRETIQGMILNCMPPYAPDIPNPALGYLKGFMQAHNFPVKNVYWNLILSREISAFNDPLRSQSQTLLSIDAVTTYIWKHLMGSTDETPLDLLFLSIFTKDELCELVHSVKDKITRYIKNENLHKVTLAGFTMKTYQWLMGWYVMDQLKQLNPDIRIVAGGLSNEDQGRAFMKVIPSIDFVIWGEGEYPLLHLVEALQDGGSVENVPHLVYREGTIHSTCQDMDYPPLDAYPFADHSDYFDTLKMGPSGMAVLIPVWGSRSCPWNKCKFCVLNEEYHYRTRSPSNIVEEIVYQSRNHDRNTFIFVDTELPGKWNRWKTLLKLLVDASSHQKEPYHFYAEVSPVFIDEEAARYMQVASFESTQIGFEAMTDSLLKKMEKRHKFVHNIQALKFGDQYGLTIIGLNIIRGIPQETREDIVESAANVRFLRFLLGKYSFRPVSLELYKGSPFYEEMSPEEREEWYFQRFWDEVSFLGSVHEDDRFEFFGFRKTQPAHTWEEFETVLDSYKQQNRTYTWVEYEDGSFIEEKGFKVYKYTLDRDETDVLIFCDSIRTFSEVKEKFSHIKEDTLLELLEPLKDYGLVYYDDTHIISVLEASKRKCILVP